MRPRLTQRAGRGLGASLAQQQAVAHGRLDRLDRIDVPRLHVAEHEDQVGDLARGKWPADLLVSHAGALLQGRGNLPAGVGAFLQLHLPGDGVVVHATDADDGDLGVAHPLGQGLTPGSKAAFGRTLTSIANTDECLGPGPPRTAVFGSAF
ncbi:MAG: hypothetical protein WD009_09965 [Phycisphaeraceae bacterium]